MILDWAEMWKSGGWSCGWLRICWCFFSTVGISFECLSVILWTPLSWNSLLSCSSSSKLWGLPCPCSSCIGTVSAGHQPVSVHVPHVIHPKINSLCYLKKDTSFCFLFFFPTFCVMRPLKISVRKTWQLQSLSKFPLSHGLDLFGICFYLMLPDLKGTMKVPEKEE